MGSQLKEVSFGLDEFGKPRELSIKDSIVQMILNVLFMRKGSFPSMPDIGINIRTYMYKAEEDIDIDELKSQISYQCSAVMQFINIGSVEAYFAAGNGVTTLVINIPVQIDNNAFDCAIGFVKDTGSLIKYNFQTEAKKIA